MSSGRDRDKASHRKEGKVSVRRKGGTHVRSFARAIIQHPQVEDAVKLREKEGHGGTNTKSTKGDKFTAVLRWIDDRLNTQNLTMLSMILRP